MATPLLSAADLIAPKGEIEESFFPSRSRDQLEADVSQWANQGLAKAAGLTTDEAKIEAATHWAYYRAYGSVYRRINALPSSVSIPTGGGHSYSASQIAEFKQMMESHLAAFEALIPVTVAPAKKGLPNPIAVRTVIVP